MTILRTARTLTALAAVAIAAIAAPNAAEASQCVENRAGYVAKVKWFEPADVRLGANKKLTFGRPVQEDTIALFGTSCYTGAERKTAVVSIVGGEYVRKGVMWGASTAIAVGGAVGCVASAGSACGALGVVAAVGIGAVQGIDTFTPDTPLKEVFYIDTPSQRTAVRLKGTVFDPHVVDGGAVPFHVDPAGLAQITRYTVKANHYLPASNARELHNLDLGACMKACTDDRQCRSFDYDSAKLRCMIQNTTARQSGRSLKNGGSNWGYWEKK